MAEPVAGDPAIPARVRRGASRFDLGPDGRDGVRYQDPSADSWLMTVLAGWIVRQPTGPDLADLSVDGPAGPLPPGTAEAPKVSRAQPDQNPGHVSGGRRDPFVGPPPPEADEAHRRAGRRASRRRPPPRRLEQRSLARLHPHCSRPDGSSGLRPDGDPARLASRLRPRPDARRDRRASLNGSLVAAPTASVPDQWSCFDRARRSARPSAVGRPGRRRTKRAPGPDIGRRDRLDIAHPIRGAPGRRVRRPPPGARRRTRSCSRRRAQGRARKNPRHNNRTAPRRAWAR